MNNRQSELYTSLMDLCDNTDSFYFADHILDNIAYRIFNHRIASYTEFLCPDALECRGHTFRLKDNGEVDALVSWTLEKFFNINENPFTQDVDLSNPEFVIEKLDGSLISTYIHNDRVLLKSKGSLSSTQANDAQYLFDNDYEHRLLRDGVTLFANRGFTVIMEYTAPDNRIVLGYDMPKLSILAIRNNENGEYISWEDLNDKYSIYFKDFISKDHTDEFVNTMDTFADDMRAFKGIEGYIVMLKTGQRIKFKTDEYFSLHKTKDNINSPRKLYECVLLEASDDLKSMYSDDAQAMKLILEMERFVHDTLNNVIRTTTEFYKENKNLERKDYAILGQSKLDKPLFGLVMNLYTENEVNYTDFMIKQWKHFGVKNDE